MNGRKWRLIAAVALFLAAVTFYGYERWGRHENGARAEVLAFMPSDASAVLYVDLTELRASPFLAQLYAWAPRPQIDVDYAQFVRETNFDYERDLDRLAIALTKRGSETSWVALADGHFDRKKIAAYAAKMGSLNKRDGREIFSVPVSGSTRQVRFMFLRDDRMALTNEPDIVESVRTKKTSADSTEWRERFRRLAGSPVFVVIRQDAGTGEAWARQAPGGLRSPQLSALLDQLQWITIAGKFFVTQGKPEGNGLRVVTEGECSEDRTVRQLADVLNGVIVLAEGGLNDAKTRKQLGPQTREAYLELLKSVDVSRIDRGNTKSVRLVFDVTPKLLEAARTPRVDTPETPAGVPKKSASGTDTAHK